MENPVLQKPGAGLPFFESLLVRYYVMPVLSKRLDWDQCTELFQIESDKILAMITPLNEEELTRKVLIRRIRGIEDSSRFWSVAMTLEHLMIVGRLMNDIITCLSEGKAAPIVVNILDVKPKGIQRGKDTVEEFRTFKDQQTNLINSKIKNRQSQVKHYHPWFGNIGIHKWYWLQAIHQRLHRKQIEKIMELL